MSFNLRSEVTVVRPVRPLHLFAMVLGICLVLNAMPASAFTVQDSLGMHTFKQPAKRVVTLNWGATEEVLELGVTPVGVADIRGYNTWVAHPEIPEGVIDVGTRAEPNVERLAELKPDLIVVGSMQQAMVERLSPIAPVLFLDNYRADHNNMAAIDRAFVQLGVALGKADYARKRLNQRDAQLAELKHKVQQYFNGQPPEVGVVRFSDGHHVRAYGRNSMPLAALQALGLKSALDIPNTTWGQVQKPVRDLAYMQGVLLYIKPLPDEDALFAKPLFRMMPVVKEQRIAPVQSTWTYGGAMSLIYLAEHFTEALTTLPEPVVSALNGEQP